MEKSALSHIHILEDELFKRKEKNALYSMRAFSKSLGMNSGVLSLIMNGKRVPSLLQAQGIADRLDINPEKKSLFMDSVALAKKNRTLQRISPDVRKYKFSSAIKADTKFKKLENDYYHMISDWHYVTILEMTRLEGFKSSAKWIAGQLSITEIEAKMAIESLMNLGLLVKDEEGNLKTVDQQFRLEDMYTATSQARRKKQKQIREKAISSIDNDDIAKRSMTSMTMCIDIELMPKAKELIAEFNEAMCKLLESGKKEKIYAMEISLFPLQK
jgi:uncharacterized protein (TIGR02147 family)